jgi:hypothetical protein
LKVTLRGVAEPFIVAKDFGKKNMKNRGSSASWENSSARTYHPLIYHG